MCQPHEKTSRAPGGAWSSTACAVPVEYPWTPHGTSTTSTPSQPATTRLITSGSSVAPGTTLMRPSNSASFRRSAPGRRRPPRGRAGARAAPCSGRAYRTRRRCRPSSCASLPLDEPVLGGPAGELVPGGQLELAQHARDVALDRLHGQVQARGDLLVHVAAGDQLEDLALARGQLVQLGVARDALAGPERVEDEAREPRREDRVTGPDPFDRGRQLLAGDRLRHVPTRARPDDADHVLGRIRDRQRQEANARPFGRNRVDDRVAASVRKMHVEEDDVRVELLDQRHGVGHGPGLADDLHRPGELRPDAGEEERVVVHQDDARLHDALRSTRSSTSVPSSGALTIVACPPARSSRPSIESTSPRRSGGTAARSKPAPRWWTKTATASSVTSA